MIGQKGIPAVYGGVERHVEELSLELAKNGHDVLVYARAWYSNKQIKKYNGVTIIQTPTVHTKHLDTIIHTFTSTIHALWKKANVIHYHGVGPSLLAFIPRILSPKTKVIVTFHCIDRYHQKWGILAKLILALGEWTACHFPHETIAVSNTIQNYCLNEFQKNTVLIPNGVKIPQKNMGANSLYNWNLENKKYALLASRLVRHKGVHYLLEAWQIAKMKKPELFKNYNLVIAGGSAFTEKYVKELHDLAKSDKSIVFTGWQSGQALEELYANTSLLIHPSENEGLPLTVLQAMSYAKPVLVSDIPEHKEVITDNNFWFANASVVSLTEKLIELLADEKKLAEAGKENKKIASKKYDWSLITKKTIMLYGQKGKTKIAEWEAVQA